MKNLLKYSVLILLTSLSMNSFSQDLSEKQKAGVVTFIENIENQNWEDLSNSINYPIHRDYPVPAIENSAEFLERYEELFDDSLISIIANSDVDKDWSKVGWRGIMMSNGTIWLDDNGSLASLNYQTKIEQENQKTLIEEDRASLHIDLQDFSRPILQMDVIKFRIRIDEMEDGSYRYAHWTSEIEDTDAEAHHVSQNGVLTYDGSGGNHIYSFDLEHFQFDCSIIVLGEDDSPPAELIISKDGNHVLTYPAVWLKN